MRVLVVEDDAAVADGILDGLANASIECVHVGTGAAALAEVSASPPDLVVLDLGLPDMDGTDVCRAIRASTATPIIVVSARDAVAQRVAGLDAGADDYLAKPFDLDELVARVRALLRRHDGAASGAMMVGNLALDPVRRSVMLRGDEVHLTAKEFALLEALMRRPGAVLSRERLEEAIYGWGEEVCSNAVEVHLHNLRRKLGGELVRNVRGVGYCIAE